MNDTDRSLRLWLSSAQEKRICVSKSDLQTTRMIKRERHVVNGKVHFSTFFLTRKRMEAILRKQQSVHDQTQLKATEPPTN